MKNQKGVTLIELVIVIIILILLAVIAVWNTQNTISRAEAATIISEFKSVYEAASTMKDLYNSGHDLFEGKDYCEKVTRSDGEWYVVYGIQDYTTDESTNKYNEKVVKEFLGIDELKRSYEFKISEDDTNSSDVEVRYYGNRYVTVSGYDIKTYEDIQNAKNEIVK